MAKAESAGQWMVYFALTGKWKSEARSTFTAVSRAPYLKAVIRRAPDGFRANPRTVRRRDGILENLTERAG